MLNALRQWFRRIDSALARPWPGTSAAVSDDGLIFEGEVTPLRRIWPLLDDWRALVAQHEGLLAHSDALVVRPTQTVIIAMTARTGSSALCSAVAHAGLAKQLGEWFNPRGVVQQEFGASPQSTIERYVSDLVARHSVDGRLIFKTSWADFEPFVANGLLDRLLPNRRYVFLDRRDRAAQAVSIYRAVTSGYWHSTNAARKERVQDVPFDLEAILRFHRTILDEEALWRDFFIKDNAEPLHVTYEDFQHDFSRAVDPILEFVGNGPPKPTSYPTDFQKISGEMEAVWARAVGDYLSGNRQAALELQR